MRLGESIMSPNVQYVQGACISNSVKESPPPGKVCSHSAGQKVLCLLKTRSFITVHRTIYPGPVDSSPHPHILFLENPFYIGTHITFYSVHIYFLCHTEVQENSQSCCLLLLCRCSKPTELLAECVPLCRSQSTA